MEIENLGPRILILTWCLACSSLCFLSLRLYCKFMTHRGLWWDDYILAVSWLSLLGSVILVTFNVQLGSGKHVWDVPPQNLSPMSLQGNVIGTLSILAAVWSKTSFALTLLRLMKGKMSHLLWTIVVSMNIAMGLNALFIWVRCNPVSRSWNYQMPGTCWAKEVYPIYGMFAAGYSAAMDFILAFLPWRIIWGLQMQKKEKLGVAIAMSMGVFAGATAIVKTIEIPSLASGDFSYHSTGLIIWSAAESAVTIMAASIPILRVLFRDIKATSRQYYLPGAGGTKDSRDSRHSKLSKAQTSIVTITAHRVAEEDVVRMPEFMHRPMSRAGTPMGIVRTDAVYVDYGGRGEQGNDVRGMV